MDYDKTDIPSAYNRGRDHGSAFRLQWMNVVAAQVQHQSVRQVLDLGCGTGRFSQGLAEQFECAVVGIDPSRKMLDQARAALQHDRVSYVCACAEAIPLASNSVDLIFISMVFHHFEKPQLAAQECSRVLRKHGRVCLRTGGRERISDYPYVPFFPTSRPLLEQHLPTLEFQRHVFESAGFLSLASEVVVQEIAADLFDYADKLSTKSDSILVRLKDAEFDAGLQRLRSTAATTASRAVTEPIDLLVFEK